MNILKKIEEIAVGQTGNIFLLCKELTEKEGKNGKYLQFTLFDGKKEIKAFQWESSLNTTTASAGSVIAVVLNVGKFKDSLSYTVKNCRKTVPADNICIQDFIPSVPEDTEEMYEKIMETISMMENKQISLLVQTIYESNKEQLLKWSAAKTAHHNILGGLIYHSYRMMKQAIVTADIYPSLNKDIMIAGCLLHDIGKLKELDFDNMGITSYSVDGSLLGHILMGSDMVKEYGEKLGIAPEIIRILRHIIASHHGKMEYGAPVLPCVSEAFIVHYLDMIDSRMYILEEAHENMEPGQLGKERNYFLDNVTLYRSSL